VPLDPTFPSDRLSIYLEDSQSVALVTERKNLTSHEQALRGGKPWRAAQTPGKRSPLSA